MTGLTCLEERLVDETHITSSSNWSQGFVPAVLESGNETSAILRYEGIPRDVAKPRTKM